MVSLILYSLINSYCQFALQTMFWRFDLAICNLLCNPMTSWVSIVILLKGNSTVVERVVYFFIFFGWQVAFTGCKQLAGAITLHGTLAHSLPDSTNWASKGTSGTNCRDSSPSCPCFTSLGIWPETSKCPTWNYSTSSSKFSY